MAEIIQDFGTFTLSRGTFSLTRQRRTRTLADEYQGISEHETVQALVLTVGSLSHEACVAPDYSKEAEIGLVVAARAIMQTVASLTSHMNAGASYFRNAADSRGPWPIPVLGPAKAQYIDPLPKPTVIA